MDYRSEPLDAPFGRAIFDLALDSDIPAPVARTLREEWLEHGLLVFPRAGQSEEHLLRLSRCLGTLEPHPIESFRERDYPELIRLGNEERVTGSIYEFDGVATCGRLPWHTDLAFRVRPNAGALLRMVKRPPDGGQTGWLDTALAYDTLDPEMQQHISALEAVYVFRGDIDQIRFNRSAARKLKAGPDDYGSFEPVVNPLVSRHPETGRKVLNLSLLNIDRMIGMPIAESDALIQTLIDHATQTRFAYMHDWAEHDIVAWDNRRTMHCTMGHPVEQVRVVQRSTISGTADLGREITPAEMAQLNEQI